MLEITTKADALVKKYNMLSNGDFVVVGVDGLAVDVAGGVEGADHVAVGIGAELVFGGVLKAEPCVLHGLKPLR